MFINPTAATAAACNHGPIKQGLGCLVPGYTVPSYQGENTSVTSYLWEFTAHSGCSENKETNTSLCVHISIRPYDNCKDFTTWITID